MQKAVVELQRPLDGRAVALQRRIHGVEDASDAGLLVGRR